MSSEKKAQTAHWQALADWETPKAWKRMLRRVLKRGIGKRYDEMVKREGLEDVPLDAAPKDERNK